MVPHLLNAGFACWVQGTRSIGSDLRLEHELALYDVAAGVSRLRELGFKCVLPLGNSGGAGLFAFYCQQSLLTANDRIAHTPGGRPTKLETAALPQIDGLIFIAPHPGQGKLLQNAIDPSLADELDPFSVNLDLFALDARNGFRMPPQATQYDQDFVSRYRAAQSERVRRLDANARELIALRQKARKALASNVDRMRAAYTGIFHVWRTDADLRCFDLALDPSERRWGTVWGTDPIQSNLGSVGFARICTPESWLSTWSGLSSNASFERCGPAIEQPVLMIEYTGDNTVFPSDCEAIFAAIGATDKIRHRVRGNHHGQSLVMGEPAGQEQAGALVAQWLREKFSTFIL
jgi:hypothetical protein